MRDKIVLGVTLSIVTLLTLVIYGIIDASKSQTQTATNREQGVVEGRRIYAEYCIQCHGPQGEGCIGPALNRSTWRPRIGGEANLEFDDGSTDLIRRTIARGRSSNQPGIEMPPWSVNENGPLNDQQIDDLLYFIQYGDWNTVIEDAKSATNLNEDLPKYAGFDDPERLKRVKEVMLANGCLNCHIMGKGGGIIGADLTDVGSRRTAEWLRDWIKDPKSVPQHERGPNLWLIGPTPTLPLPPGSRPSLTPTATPQVFPMGPTYMPTIKISEEDLQLMVDYLSRARTSTR
jgi:mono/diheme cytochrome c family protein